MTLAWPNLANFAVRPAVPWLLSSESLDGCWLTQGLQMILGGQWTAYEQTN